MQVTNARQFILSLQTLPLAERVGVYKWIIKHKEDFAELKKKLISPGGKKNSYPDELYALSLQSFADDWDAPENNHWDKLYVKQKS